MFILVFFPFLYKVPFETSSLMVSQVHKLRGWHPSFTTKLYSPTKEHGSRDISWGCFSTSVFSIVFLPAFNS